MAREIDDHEGFEGEGEGLHDRLSAPEPDERRAVHPYRESPSNRDALIARRRAKQRELERAERAAERRERLKRELVVIDDELRAQPSPLLDAIAITTPCRAHWEEMRGDDVVRHCGRCHRDVFDLSKMTEGEIETLFTRVGAACVRLRRRPDGRIVTADCPRQPPGLVARGARALAAGMLFGTAAGISATLAQPGVILPDMTGEPLEEMPPPRRVPVPPIDVSALRSSEEPAPADDTITMGVPDVPTLQPIAAPAITTADLDRHIRWIAPQAWEIDRALVERLLNEPTAHPHRLIPSRSGIRIYGIRRNSLAGRLGLMNGDTLLDVNGHSLAGPGGVIGAYEQLHDASAFFVRIERRGEERLHVYRVTP